MIVGQYFPQRTDWKAKAAVGGQCAFAQQTQRPCGALTTRSPIFPEGRTPQGARKQGCELGSLAPHRRLCPRWLGQGWREEEGNMTRSQPQELGQGRSGGAGG